MFQIRPPTVERMSTLFPFSELLRHREHGVNAHPTIVSAAIVCFFLCVLPSSTGAHLLFTSLCIFSLSLSLSLQFRPFGLYVHFDSCLSLHGRAHIPSHLFSLQSLLSHRRDIAVDAVCNQKQEGVTCVYVCTKDNPDEILSELKRR
jgi:hypothetical protein